MEIRPIATRADLRRFIELPYRLYRYDPNWVPPLRGEQAAQFDPLRNPMLAHCEYALFLLVDGREPVGRISAFVDRLAVETWQEPIGLFGSFECAGGGEGSRLLLGAAHDWLSRRGMTRMRGPWSFASQEWGLLVEGFPRQPSSRRPTIPPRTTTISSRLAFGRPRTCWRIISTCARGTTSRHATSP